MYVIKKSSWHYKFIKFIGFMKTWPRDICEYRILFIKSLISALIVGSFVTGLSLAYVYFTVDSIMWVLVSYMYGLGIIILERQSWGQSWVILILNLCILFVASMYFLISKIKYLLRNIRISGIKEKEPGAMALMYTSWKEKFCVPVKFEE